MINNKVEQIKEHLEECMRILGIEKTESNKNTPLRISKMWVNELFKNVNNNNLDELRNRMTMFSNDYGTEMVIVKDIEFHSTCEHHFLPFSGKVSIGYVPSEQIIGLSKLPRVVRYFSKKPQLQEKLTQEVGKFLSETLDPKALFIEVEATHTCVSCRGAESDCSTVTYYKETCKGYENSYNEFRDRMRGA